MDEIMQAIRKGTVLDTQMAEPEDIRQEKWSMCLEDEAQKLLGVEYYINAISFSIVTDCR